MKKLYNLARAAYNSPVMLSVERRIANKSMLSVVNSTTVWNPSVILNLIQHLRARYIIGIALSVLIALPLFNSCKTAYPSAEVHYLTGDDQTLTARSIGLGKDEETAIVNAEQKVFDVLLFRGLPDSKQKLPMIGTDESAARSKNPSYFDNFYNNRRHKTFVISSIPVTNAIRMKGGLKQITLDVKINLAALRKDLETAGAIRRFGY
jgi:hypothetical protein